MPVSYTVAPEDDLVAVFLEGHVSMSEMRNCLRTYWRDSGFDRTYDVAFLLEKNVTIGLTASAIVSEMKARIQAMRGDAAYRLVCAGGSVDARTVFLASFEAMNNKAERGAFKTHAEGLRWLESDATANELRAGASVC